MCCKGFIKRVFPFFLTFSVGLFIASFFVSIALPTFRLRNDGWRRHEQYHRMLEFENQQLKERNSLLEKRLADRDSSDAADNDSQLNYLVPPPPPVAPIAPSVRIHTIPYRVK